LAFGLVLMGQLGGCGRSSTPTQYKEAMDKQVYQIIDQKWQDDHGVQANYRISDTAASNDVQGERTAPPSGILTLRQAVSLATQYNHEYHLQRELLYTTALDLGLTRYQFETQYFGSPSLYYFRSRDGTKSVQGAANLGFNRLLKRGAMVTGSVAAAWIDILTGNTRSGLSSMLNVTVAQPLLRGSRQAIVQEPLTQAERNVLYQIRSFNRFRQTFIVLVIDTYYQVLELADVSRNATFHRDTLDRLHMQVEQLTEAGRLPMEESERVRQEVLRASDLQVQAEHEYQQLLDTLKILIGLPTIAQFGLDRTELDWPMTVEPALPEFSEDEAVETAWLQRLDLVNSADAVMDAERQVTVAADGLRADLNLILGSNTAAGTNRNATAWADSSSEIGLGLQAELPWNRELEKNLYRKALILQSQRQREYDLLIDTVALEVREAYRSLLAATKRHQIQLESLTVAEKRLQDTLALMQYGKASSRRVLSAQSDLFEARNEAVDARVDYLTATLEFYSAAGTLHVRQDGWWERQDDKFVSRTMVDE
jgi:outer membrane protein TolC